MQPDNYLTRDDYLKERAAWKEIYMTTSTVIKMYKKLRKAAATGGWSRFNDLQSYTALMGNEACAQMLDLEDLKQSARDSVDWIRSTEGRNYFSTDV